MERIGGATHDDLQSMLEDAARAAGAAGAQLSVALGEQTVDLACGLANAERGDAMTVDTIGMVGSITKLFNAAMLVSLADAGALSLDVPIAEYVPDLSLAEGAQHLITLRQLLSMSAGLDNGPYAVRGGGEDSLSDYVRSLGDVDLVHRPGQGFGYSNAGVCVAGYVAQCAMRRHWGDLVRTEVLGPCGITEFAFGADELPFHRVSVGHQRPTAAAPHSLVRPWGHHLSHSPSGSSLAMSARELARFGRILAGRGSIDGRTALRPGAVDRMTTPTVTVPGAIPQFGVGDAWGLGPSRSHWDGQTVWSHSGGVQSARTLLSWLPAFQGVLALTVNTPDAFPMLVTRLMGTLGTAVFGVRDPASPGPPSPLVVSDVQRYVGTYARFGTRYDLHAHEGRLRYVETNLGVGVPGERRGVVVDCECTPVARDRFLIAIPGFDGLLPLSFEGDDGGGRATRLVSTLLCARRLDGNAVSDAILKIA